VSAVTVRDLRKSYGDHEALRGIDFTIEAGEVFGLLGPNGAGKTTTVEILEGYRRPDSGSVEVLGLDPQRSGSAWRERIGVMLQSSSLYPALTVRESLGVFAGYYSAPRDPDEVLGIVGLDEKRDARVRTLSGGQQRRLDLPILPMTTIGSFPQTDALRTARAELRQGTINSEQYESGIADEIKHVIELQESLGLDVLVHGEAERNDMVQYFAEQLHGFLSTKHGWVQSYGTRCVRPPILAGDVSRPEPMTVRWTKYAQGLTDRPMKGMLTGPVDHACVVFRP